MYHGVMALCEDNLPMVASVAAFQTSYNLFKTTVTLIVEASTRLEAQTGGWRTSKKTAKNELAKSGSEIAGLVAAYASSIKDEVLAGAVHITDTDIIRAKDEEVVAKCRNIYKAANENVAALVDYGITPALLSVFETAINDYVNLSPKPRGSRSEKKSVRQQMYAQFANADILLKMQMDKLAVNFLNNGNKPFYLEYKAARVIIDPGSFKTVLKLQVLNTATNEPLRNVKCYRDVSAVFKLSSDKGVVTFKDAEQGNHIFKFKRKLFKDTEVEVMVTYGEKKRVIVLMEPKF